MARIRSTSYDPPYPHALPCRPAYGQRYGRCSQIFVGPFLCVSHLLFLP